MRTSNLLIATVLLVLLAAPALADYPMFGLDPHRTGNVSGDAPLSNMRLWDTKLGEKSYIGGGASVVGDRVYVANWPTMLPVIYTGLGLHCLDKSDGSVIWNTSIGKDGGVSTPAIADDRVFVGSRNGAMYCVNAGNGTAIWNITIDLNPGYHGVASSPLIYGGVVYVVSHSDGTLHAIDFDGAEQWTYSASGNSNTYMSAATDGSRIFFGGGKAMHCVDIEKQNVIWTYPVSRMVATTPAACDGVVYFATGKGDKKLYAVNTTTGDLVWSRHLYGSISSPAISNGRIYIGDDDWRLNCFNASNGNEIWSQTLGGRCKSSPVVAGGMVYTATNYGKGTIYCFDADDGAPKWSYDTGDFVMAQPSVSDGILFVGSDTGYLYAFGTPDKFWKGNAVLLSGETLDVTARNSGTNYTINRTTALGALAKAAGYGGFNFTISDSDYAASGKLHIGSIADIPNDETEGKSWHYRANYPAGPKPDVGANEYELNTSGDVVTFYYGESMVVPETSSVVIEITTQVIEEKPEAIFITVERHPSIAAVAPHSNLNVTIYYPGGLPESLDLFDYDLIFLEHISDKQALERHNLTNVSKSGVPVISIHTAVQGNVDPTEHPLIKQYWENCDPENIARLLTYLEVNFCGLIGNIEGPLPVPEAIHHPDAPDLFLDTGSYIDWYSSKIGYRYNRSNITIGIISHIGLADFHDMEALVYKLEEKGVNVISIEVRGTDAVKGFYINDTTNETLVDTIISSRSFRINFDNGTQGVEDLKTLGVPVMKAVRMYNENDTGLSFWKPGDWRSEPSHGISIVDLFQVGIPELDAIIDPIVISGRYSPNTTFVSYLPIDEQIDWMSDRAISWARLRHVPDSERKVAMIYYDHGCGKGNLGATYVNVPPSLQNILEFMNESGYTVEGEIPNETVLVSMMTSNGTNIGSWAPGELKRLVASGTATLIPVETYLGWFGELEAKRQAEVVKRWGEPPGEIMTWKNETTGEEYFVIPKLSFENVILTPQPTRGWLQNNTILYHSKAIPPHHQYIAFYLWLKQEPESGGFGADAIIHFGKHGTQEWLPGKESGLSILDCWPAILIQDMPVIYPYIVDNIAEGTQAKRRGGATMITHLTPPIIMSGLYGNLTNLLRTISDYNRAYAGTPVKEEYKAQIISLYQELYLEDALKINLTASPDILEDDARFDEFADEVAHYLYDIKMAKIPYGLHTFGDPPTGDPMVLMVNSMLRDSYRREVAAMIGYSGYPDPTQVANESKLDNCTGDLLKLVLINGSTPEDAQKIVFDVDDSGISSNITSLLKRAILFKQRISACDIEVPRTLAGLNGSYIPPSSADDPIRDPDALPTGRNFHSLNPDRIPTKAAYETGKNMSELLIERYRQDHDNAYPRKLEIILWAWCATDGGVVESEILYLVGAEPVRDDYDRVIDVKLIPVSELKRPRIDVLVIPSGVERDFTPNSLRLIDRAIRLAAGANDTYPNGTAYPNYVKENSDEIYHWLANNTNYTDSEARYFSMSRIFLEGAGEWGFGFDSKIGASGTWENDSVLAECFIEGMSYIYGDSVWGVYGRDVFETNLADVDAIVHNMNSNLYGLLDNDDVVMYVGGSACAIRHLTKETPDAYITDNRDPDRVVVNSLEERLTQEIYARYANPIWIEGMKGEGSAGVHEMKKFVEYLGMWDYLMPELVTGSMWERVVDVYVNDIYNLGMRDFFRGANEYEYQSMLGSMLEVIRKGYWDGSLDISAEAYQEIMQTLISEYMESIADTGRMTCCHHTCGNPLLDEYMAGRISALGLTIDKKTLDAYAEIWEETTETESALKQPPADPEPTPTPTPEPTTTPTPQEPSDTIDPSSNRKGTYPPDWEKVSNKTETSAGTSNETSEHIGGIGEDASRRANPSEGSESNYLEGQEMTVEKSEKFNTGLSFSGAPMLGMILVIALMVIIYWGYRRRR